MDPLLIFLIYASSHTFHGVYRLKGYLLSISTSFYKDFIYSRRALFLASVSSVPNYVHSYCSLNHVHRIQSPRIKTTDLIDQTLCLSYLYRTPFQFQSFFWSCRRANNLKIGRQLCESVFNPERTARRENTVTPDPYHKDLVAPIRFILMVQFDLSDFHILQYPATLGLEWP